MDAPQIDKRSKIGQCAHNALHVGTDFQGVHQRHAVQAHLLFDDGAAAQRKSTLGGRKTYHVHMQCFSHVFFGVPHRARIEEGHWEKSCSVAHVHDEAAFYLAKNTGVQALSAMHGLLQNVHIVGSDTQGLGCSCWEVGPWHGMEYLG